MTTFTLPKLKIFQITDCGSTTVGAIKCLILVEKDTRTIGRALDIIPGGPAQFIYKKMQDDPNARKAIDDLNQLIDRRRSYASDIADILMPGLGIAGAAGKAAKLGSKAKKAATLSGPSSRILSSNSLIRWSQNSLSVMPSGRR